MPRNPQVSQAPTEGASEERFFFHLSNFKHRETPTIGAYVVFGLAPGISNEKRLQAVGVRLATSEEVKQNVQQASPKTEVRP
jgi:hypothetical protein